MGSLLVALSVTLLASACCQAAPGSAAADCGPEAAAAAADSRAYLRGLDRLGVLGATFAAYNRGCLAFEEAYGYAVPELKAPMRPDIPVPIGSNSKLFTATLIWQLHEAGLLDVDAPVTQYMEAADFNRTEPWCPRVRGAPAGAPCTPPTLRQLLSMGSGLVDIDNCDYLEGAWQLQYCTSLFDAVLPLRTSAELTGGRPPADFFSRVWDVPLEAAPGSSYRYVNSNFQLASYVIEKVAGMRYGQALRSRILEPGGLSADVLYDLANGASGVSSQFLPQGFKAVLAPVSKEYIEGVEATTSHDPEQLLAVPAGEVAALARLPPLPDILSRQSGAGSIYATPRGLLSFWHTLLFQPEALNLTEAAVREMLGSTNPHSLGAMPGFPSDHLYAQASLGMLPPAAVGIAVKPDPAFQPYGVSQLYYWGAMNGFDSPFLLRLLAEDARGPEDAAAAGLVFFVRPELAVPFNASSCEAESPWEDGPPAVLGEAVCALLQPQGIFPAGGFGMQPQVVNRFFRAWGLRNVTVD